MGGMPTSYCLTGGSLTGKGFGSFGLIAKGTA